MSWIKVKRDNTELLVSTESYRDLFSKQGYTIVADNQSPTQPQPISEEKEIESKEVEKDELQTKSTGGKGKVKHKTGV